MRKLEKQHEKEVEKLKTKEKQLSELILEIGNEQLMEVFIEWQEQRNVCNCAYNQWLSEVLNSASEK